MLQRQYNYVIPEYQLIRNTIKHLPLNSLRVVWKYNWLGARLSLCKVRFWHKDLSAIYWYSLLLLLIIRRSNIKVSLFNTVCFLLFT